MICLQSFLLTSYTSGLTRRSTNETVTIGDEIRINLAYIAQNELCVWVIPFISGTTTLFELISSNHMESCLFKT